MSRVPLECKYPCLEDGPCYDLLQDNIVGVIDFPCASSDDYCTLTFNGTIKDVLSIQRSSCETNVRL